MTDHEHLWHIDWRDEFAIGDPVIDAQHRAFFAEVGQLRAAILSDQPQQRYADYCATFSHSLRRHFADEEQLMAEMGYPGLDDHRSVHRHLLARVEAVRDQVAAAPCLLDCILASRSLIIMLIEHLLHDDMRLKAFLDGPAKEECA
ncbi:MAG: bacteriohemerythrin [Actinomycetota bacterium]